MALDTHPAVVSLSEADLRRIPADVREKLQLPKGDKARRRQGTQVIVLGTEPRGADVLSKAVVHLVAVLPERMRERDEASIDRLVDFYLEGAGRSPAEEQLLRENAELRAEFFEEVPVLTAAQVGRNAHSRSTNPSEPASRWKREGRIFAVTRGKTDLFPAFQFDENGQPRPIIREILGILPPEMSPWQRAFWFVSANGWLDGAYPVERLEERDAVLDAARQLADPAVG
jgi:hypothetical protein